MLLKVFTIYSWSINDINPVSKMVTWLSKTIRRPVRVNISISYIFMQVFHNPQLNILDDKRLHYNLITLAFCAQYIDITT